MPEAQPLALLRRNIDRKPHLLKQVLTEPQMRSQILGGIPNDEKKAVKAFAGQNTENALKTKPKVRTERPLGIFLQSMSGTACGITISRDQGRSLQAFR